MRKAQTHFFFLRLLWGLALTGLLTGVLNGFLPGTPGLALAADTLPEAGAPSATEQPPALPALLAPGTEQEAAQDIPAGAAAETGTTAVPVGETAAGAGPGAETEAETGSGAEAGTTAEPAAGTDAATDTTADTSTAPPTPALPIGPAPEPLPWQQLEPGLEYADFDREDQSRSTVVVLRFDPAFFVFSLHTISEKGGPPKTLRQWAEAQDLVAAINASMYLPDGSTSTGFMRNGGHINNKRIAGRFGVFFVAEPDDASLPSVALMDKDTEGWEQKLNHYKVVVQNYRMINARRNILWSPGGPLYSISAVGQDGSGKILFMHCREPIDAYSFASLLLHLPLDVRTVMYVEGGAQAGLALRTRGYSLAWGGRHPADFLVTGNVNAALPNILGVKRRLPSPDASGSNSQ